MQTRAEKVERHFRNSVQTKLIELMKIMDPGGQRDWSYNYKDLLKDAKERIEAELLHENGFEEDATPPEDVITTEKPTALALPKPS